MASPSTPWGTTYFDFASNGFDPTPAVTHRFPLDRWDDAVLTLKNSWRAGAVKVLLEPVRVGKR